MIAEMEPGHAARFGTVRDWMTRAPELIPTDCPIEQALVRMRAAEVRHPVREGDDIIGIFTTSDGLWALLAVIERT
jgi:predicted transcriptional regulator